MYKIFPILFSCLIINASGAQSLKEKLFNSPRQCISLLNSLEKVNNAGFRAFTMRFDTLSILFSDPDSPESLVSTMPVTYDASGRVKETKVINAGADDFFIYRYHYIGSDNRFSTLEYFLHSGGTEQYAGVQIHLYDSHGRLISSKELDKNNNLIYGDSLTIEYNATGQIEFYEYLFFQQGKWNLGRRVSNVLYNGPNLISYITTEVEKGHGDADTAVPYLYDDVIFINDDPSILFPDFDEFFEIDSLGVNDFFLSRDDAAPVYIKQPVKYLKYRMDGTGALVEMAEYASDDFLSRVNDVAGNEKYRVEYTFDGVGRLKKIHKSATGSIPEISTFEYNELGRIARYEFTSDSLSFMANSIYITDAKERLREYYQNLQDTHNSITNILRFGYKDGQVSNNQQILEAGVFPNPASNTIHINLPQSSGRELPVKIFDTMGKMVYSGMTRADNRACTLTLDKNIPAGIYVLWINDGQLRYRATIVLI